MTSWKGRGKENTFKYLLYFKHLKKPLSHLFLLSTLWDKYFLYFTSEKLLMLGKMKYFVFIPSKSKNKGHDLNPGCCTPMPALSSPSHFTMTCFHMWRHRSVSPCLPQALSASGMYVFILLTQNQPLTDRSRQAPFSIPSSVQWPQISHPSKYTVTSNWPLPNTSDVPNF